MQVKETDDLEKAVPCWRVRSWGVLINPGTHQRFNRQNTKTQSVWELKYFLDPCSVTLEWARQWDTSCFHHRQSSPGEVTLWIVGCNCSVRKMQTVELIGLHNTQEILTFDCESTCLRTCHNEQLIWGKSNSTEGYICNNWEYIESMPHFHPGLCGKWKCIDSWRSCCNQPGSKFGKTTWYYRSIR